MTIRELYDQIGDYDDVLARLMSDKLIEKFALKFENDKSYGEMKEALDKDDRELAFRAVHTLKGVAANLSFVYLRKAASELTEQIRSQEQAADPALVAEVERCYTEVIDALKRFQAEKA